MRKKKNVYQHYEFLRAKNTIAIPFVTIILGTETYYKDIVLKTILSKLAAKTDDHFDYSIEHGDTSFPHDIVENLEMPPFLAKYKVVVLKKFDEMIASAKNIIADYCRNPLSTSRLIIIAASLDARQSAVKKIRENALIIECKQPYNQKAIINWLSHEPRLKNIVFSQDAMDLFAATVDLNYMVASNELDKLLLYIGSKKSIDSNDVSECVGHSRINSIFELQDYVAQKDLKNSMLILENLMENEESGIFVLAILTNFFTLIWKIVNLRKEGLSPSEISHKYIPEVYPSYRQKYVAHARGFDTQTIKLAFMLLAETDFQLKSLNINQAIIMENMVYKLCTLK